AGGQHVVGARAVVAQGHRRVVPDEDRSGVAHPGGDGPGVGGHDLQVFGGVGVDDLQAVVEVVDEDDAGLGAAQGLGDAVAVLGGGHPRGEFGLDAGGEALGGGDQDRGGDDVVFGLADQVDGDVAGVGGVVGEDGDLGGPGLGVDADDALEQALGRGDPDVAGAGDHVGAGALARAVGEHGDGLGAAHGVDLVDAEQGAGGQDGGVR